MTTHSPETAAPPASRTGTVAAAASAVTPRVTWGLLALLLLPAWLHAVGVAISVYRQDTLKFEPFDFWALCLLVAYLAGTAFVASSRTKALVYVLIVYSSLLTLGGVELVCRILLPPVLPNVPRIPNAKQAGTVRGNFPGLDGVEYTYTVNSLGVRGPEVRLADQDLRILCVGGSTTECMYIPDKLSWPWALQDKLAERLDKKVFVGNAGAGGHNTLHHEYQLRNYDLVPQFEWVVVLCGYNDMAGDPEYMSKLKIGEMALTPTTGKQAYYRQSALVRLLRRVFVLKTQPHVVIQDEEGRWIEEDRKRRQEHLAMNTVREPPEDFPEHLAFYRGNLKKIIQTCRARNVNLVMLTQPVLYFKDMPPELDRLLWMFGEGFGASTSDCLERQMNAFNTVMRQVCKEEGVDCIDLATLLPKDTTVFYDDCHFNISGCTKIADILTDFFVAKFAPAGQ